MPAEPVEPPPRERLELGELSAFPTMAQRELGRSVSKAVDLYNQLYREHSNIAYKVGSSALHYGDYLNAYENGDGPFQGRRNALYTDDYKGYLSYLLDLDPYLAAAITPELNRKRYITENPDRIAHTFIAGGSRSGKSELLKLMVHHYVKHPELGGVLVIDPHGDIAPKIARWREFAGKGAGRLVYLDPALGEELGHGVPALNPFQGAGPNSGKGKLAFQLAEALTHFAEDGEAFSGQMLRVATNCLMVLLEMKGTSPIDLWRGLGLRPQVKGMARPLPPFVEQGASHPNEALRRFFSEGWESESYRSSRDALARRLESYIVNQTFWQMMEAPSPIDLEALLNAGKVVVVNTAFDKRVGRALGRLLMAQVAAIGERRHSNRSAPAAPFHVFVDEATSLMSPTFVGILEEVGKRNIWLTMVQQLGGANASREEWKRIATNTHLKFVSRSTGVKSILQFVDVGRDDVPDLQQGEFVVVKGGQQRAPMVLKTPFPSPLAGDSNAMGEEEWASVLGRQFAAYYRKAPEPKPAASAAGPAGGSGADEWRQE